MSVTFARKLASIPGYVAGVPAGKAPEAIARSDIAQLASNESPWGPHPAVVEAIARAAGASNRYPDPAATLLRRRIAERHETDPAQVAVANGSCEVLLAAALALCEPGAEIVYAWPSFSIYPYLAPLSGAREVRVALDDGDAHDLEAMFAEVTSATQVLIVCNPNNPTATHLPAARIAELCERVPGHVTVIVDEAYVEFQLDDDPDATADLRREFPNLVCLRTFSKVHGLAGLRVGYALCSPAFRAAVDAVRQPFSVNAVAQAAAAEAILHSDDVARRVERTIVERVTVEEGVRELGLRTPDSQANFSWIALEDARRGRGRRRARRARYRGPRRHPAGRARSHQGQLRHAGAEPALPRWPRRARLAAVGREVLVVPRRARPGAAPAPARPAREGAHDAVAAVQHAPRVAGAVGERRPGRGRDVRSRHVGVLDRVEVDRPPVGVHGPAPGAGDETAVEGRGVVGRHRAPVVGAVAVDQLHAPDRVPDPVEAPHHREHRLVLGPVDDQPAVMGLAVEAPVAQLEQAQPRVVDRAPRVPGAADDPLLDPALDRPRAALERGRAGSGQRAGEGEHRERLHRAILGARIPRFADPGAPCYKARMDRAITPALSTAAEASARRPQPRSWVSYYWRFS